MAYDTIQRSAQQSLASDSKTRGNKGRVPQYCYPVGICKLSEDPPAKKGCRSRNPGPAKLAILILTADGGTGEGGEFGNMSRTVASCREEDLPVTRTVLLAYYYQLHARKG